MNNNAKVSQEEIEMTVSKVKDLLRRAEMGDIILANCFLDDTVHETFGGDEFVYLSVLFKSFESEKIKLVLDEYQGA